MEKGELSTVAFPSLLSHRVHFSQTVSFLFFFKPFSISVSVTTAIFSSVAVLDKQMYTTKSNPTVAAAALPGILSKHNNKKREACE